MDIGQPRSPLIKLSEFDVPLEESWQDIRDLDVYDVADEQIGSVEDLYLDREAFREAFAADVDPETAGVMAAAQRPYAAAAFAGTPSGPPAWKTLPCWYLLGTEDKAIPPALQRFMAERANATIVEVPASHVSFVSQPEAATQLILQAVEATMLPLESRREVPQIR